jgi:putative nucleotidyltransferase with HDIG domain
VRSPTAGDRSLPQQAVARARLFVPVALVGAVLAYQFVIKDAVGLTGTPGKLVDMILLFLVGPAMAWWGLGIAGSLLNRLIRSEVASEEKGRLLETRNRQLQTLLAASRAISSVLDLPEVGRVIVEQAIAHTRFTQASLVLGPDENGQFHLATASGLPAEHLQAFMAALHGKERASSPVEWCRLTLQPVVVEDVARDFRTSGLRHIFEPVGTGAIVCAPLMLGNKFQGALTVYLDRKSSLSTAEVSIISALSSQAALALENARLYTLTRTNRARLDKAMAFLEVISSALARTRVGVSPLLRLVAQATAKLFEPAAVRLVVRRGVPGRTHVLTETSGEGATPDGKPLQFPITLDGQHFGHLELYLKGEHTFNEDDQRILQAFVHLTASALGNASLVSGMQRAVDQVEQAYMGTLEALTKALELRDHETEGHSRRVVQYTIAIAQKLGVPEQTLTAIIRGALLHDIGKIGIPDSILRKPGPLTEEEWAIMQRHTKIGYEMLHQIDFLQDAAPIILYHHERYDGTGYPAGLAAEEIPLGARVFSVADAYDAMTSDRPYRKAMSHEWALQEVIRNAGTQFDPEVVQALLSLPEAELSSIRGRLLELDVPLGHAAAAAQHR